MKRPPQQSEQKLPSEDQIRSRAYDRYEQRGRADGHDLDDWLEAEREVLEEDEVRKTAA